MKVLVLTHRLPFAPNRGDRVRAYHIVRQLARRASVHVVSLVHDAQEEAEADGMRRDGITVTTARVPRLRNYARGAARLLGSTPLTHLLLDSPAMRDAIAHSLRDGEPDVVLAYCSGMARFALEAPLDRYPFVFDVVDVDSGKWADFARVARGPRRWLYRREARCLSAFEAMAARRARAATVVTAREADALRALSPEARTHVISNGVDLQYLAPQGPPASEPSVVFTGVFSYAPNADGAVWFAEQVWPRVRERFTNARLTLAGASPPRPGAAAGRTRSLDRRHRPGAGHPAVSLAVRRCHRAAVRSAGRAEQGAGSRGGRIAFGGHQCRVGRLAAAGSCRVPARQRPAGLRRSRERSVVDVAGRAPGARQPCRSRVADVARMPVGPVRPDRVGVDGGANRRGSSLFPGTLRVPGIGRDQ
jgi:glycosyltransferase involved in cell wall biosynthesis